MASVLMVSMHILVTAGQDMKVLIVKLKLMNVSSTGLVTMAPVLIR